MDVSATAVQLKITLRDVEPPIWRRLRVPGSMTLAELHDVIQTAMGWMDYHLHLFEAGGIVYRTADDLEDSDVDDDLDRDEDGITVAAMARVGGTWRYEYDFGSEWHHDLLVEEVRSVRSRMAPVCLEGERACPPEDIGGARTYMRVLSVLADPTHPDHGATVDRYGTDLDPEYFDLDAVNEMLAL
jgi:hypothetical protein